MDKATIHPHRGEDGKQICLTVRRSVGDAMQDFEVIELDRAKALWLIATLSKFMLQDEEGA